MTSESDSGHMARALQLARRGMTSTSPNPRVGCVVARAEKVVGEGWHEAVGLAHAEINALRAAGAEASGATAYVTLEPCNHQGMTGPCADALIGAGVARVVIAQRDPNPHVAGGGTGRLEAAGIEVETGLMSEEAEALNPGFNKRMRLGLPFVRSKLAVSLDGRTAMASGESQWITGEAARADVQRWRAQSCAILTGSGTVIADNPSLNQRHEEHGRQPLRIIIDSGLRVAADARCLVLPGPKLLVTTVDDPARLAPFLDCGVEVLNAPVTPGGHCDLGALMPILAERELNEIHVEAGPGLNGALLGAGLIDELLVYQASHVMGSEGRGMFDLIGLEDIEERIGLARTELRMVGDDLRQRFRVTGPCLQAS